VGAATNSARERICSQSDSSSAFISVAEENRSAGFFSVALRLAEELLRVVRDRLERMVCVAGDPSSSWICAISTSVARAIGGNVSRPAYKLPSLKSR